MNEDFVFLHRCEGRESFVNSEDHLGSCAWDRIEFKKWNRWKCRSFSAASAMLNEWLFLHAQSVGNKFSSNSIATDLVDLCTSKYTLQCTSFQPYLSLSAMVHNLHARTHFRSFTASIFITWANCRKDTFSGSCASIRFHPFTSNSHLQAHRIVACYIKNIRNKNAHKGYKAVYRSVVFFFCLYHFATFISNRLVGQTSAMSRIWWLCEHFENVIINIINIVVAKSMLLLLLLTLLFSSWRQIHIPCVWVVRKTMTMTMNRLCECAPSSIVLFSLHI